MKYLKIAVIISLNILFCVATIWFYTHNTTLRPYAGSTFKESLCALLLLGSLYANYFLLYPKLHKKSPYLIYWLSVVGVAIVMGIVDFVIAYPFIASFNAKVIKSIGLFTFITTTLSYIIGRNLAFNFFPYLLQERKHLRHTLEKEVQVVYRTGRMLDVTDKNSNMRLVPIDDIFFCHQQGNFTIIYMVQNEQYTRLGSMRHLEQLLHEEFIQISPTLLVPFQHIESCQNNEVVMKKREWEEVPTVFALNWKNIEVIANRIKENIKVNEEASSQKAIPAKPVRKTKRRNPITPPDEKIQKVFLYIESHANCNTADIIAATQYSQSTVVRCLSELKKQKRIERVGGRKQGGYCVAHVPQESDMPQKKKRVKPVQKKKKVVRKKKPSKAKASSPSPHPQE